MILGCLRSLPLLFLACESTPVAPVEIATVDGTAIFDSLQVNLVGINYSWVPREGPIPSPGKHRVTIEVTALCYARGSCAIAPSEFRYRTWDGLRIYDRRYTMLWTPGPEGRTPKFDSITLGNGGTIRGWLTFFVPSGLSYLPDEFVWQPDPRVTFSFFLPTSSGSLVCGTAHVFGQVTDPDKVPVVDAPVVLSLYNLSREGNSFVQGECRGENPATLSSRTNAEGRFDFLPSFRFCEEMCAVLSAAGSDGSDLGSAMVSGGTVWPSTGHPLVEPSELRIDITLPNVER